MAISQDFRMSLRHGVLITRERNRTPGEIQRKTLLVSDDFDNIRIRPFFLSMDRRFDSGHRGSGCLVQAGDCVLNHTWGKKGQVALDVDNHIGM